MKLELHLLQNFAPSNLNRDDTGAPKDCEFGGYRRARVSSQCWKRAIREAFKSSELFTEDSLAVRTKRLADRIAVTLVEQHKRDQNAALGIARALVEGAGLGVKDEHKTQYLLYLPRRHIADLATLAEQYWDALAQVAATAAEPADAGDANEEGTPPAPTTQKKPKATTAKAKKNAAKAAVPKELGQKVKELLEDGTRAPDLALFGRMIADAPAWNVDAACQVAHALSTHRVSMEFDFFTAVDDFRPGETTGSDMMGTVQFNSACFYRYAVIDLDQLAKNLGDASPAAPLTKQTVAAFLRAAVRAIPTGKQNSMAAQNPPSYLLAIVRDDAPLSLANAFVRPVRPSAEADLVTASIAALETHLAQLGTLYGWAGVRLAASVADRELGPSERLERLGTFDSLVAQVADRACGAA